LLGEETKDFYIVGIDIAAYSLRALSEQKAAQVLLDQALSIALENRIDKSLKEHRWLDGGDGGYALFEWASGRDVLTFIEVVCEHIKRENATKRDESKVSFRFAIHFGKVLCWKSDSSSRYTSDAINQCARFLTGMSHDSGRIICSGIFCEKISGIDSVVLMQRVKDVVDKHDIPHEVYNLQKIPGLGLPINESDYHENMFV
jgi:hypothetical protein